MSPRLEDLPIIRFDKETKSGYSLPDTGRIKYVKHKDADIICMAWKYPNSSTTKLWLPGNPIPSPFLNPKAFRFAAFNIQFDSHIISTIGSKYGFKPLPLENQVDIMAVAARFGYPQKLDNLGKALKVNLPKMTVGKALKKLLCIPPYHDAKKLQKMGEKDYWIWHKEQVRLFYKYCIRDVDCMHEIMSKMPKDDLPPEEQHIWEVNCRMNMTGLPIDHPAVTRIVQVNDFYRTKESKRVPKLTSGEVNTIGQRDKIIAWCDERGVVLENMQAETVSKALKELDEKLLDVFEDKEVLDGWQSVHRLLRLRQKLGGAAVKKFIRLDKQTTAGRIHDNSRYHGAGTGRTTGGGFQYLNLPRAKINAIDYDLPKERYDEAVDLAIKSYYDTTVLQKNPLEVSKALVRPMIKAGPGKRLIVADWSSIEYIILMWMAKEYAKVELFRKGLDPYITFATKLYGVEYRDVTGDQRQKSKPPVLGSGYMLGWRGLIEYAEGYGVDMTPEQAQFATNTYRQEHPLVRKLWYRLKDAAHDAVKYKGRSFGTHGASFKCTKDRAGKWWLLFRLPSGRTLFYNSPKIVDGKYGDTIKHLGVHPKKKHWTWVHLNPQRIIENAIQGLGRDVLQFGMDNLIARGFTPIGTIYDEIICEEDEAYAMMRLNEMSNTLALSPPWGRDIPLRADGYISPRYKKG